MDRGIVCRWNDLRDSVDGIVVRRRGIARGSVPYALRIVRAFTAPLDRLVPQLAPVERDAPAVQLALANGDWFAIYSRAGTAAAKHERFLGRIAGTEKVRTAALGETWTIPSWRLRMSPPENKAANFTFAAGRQH